MPKLNRWWLAGGACAILLAVTIVAIVRQPAPQAAKQQQPEPPPEHGKIADPDPEEQRLKNEYAIRKPMFDTWTTALRTIATRTKSDRAKTIEAFMDERCLFGFPEGENNLIVMPGKAESVVILILTESDKKLTRWKDLVRTGGPTYLPDDGLIMLGDPEAFSETWRGMMLYYALLHARYRHGAQAPKDEQEMATLEAMVQQELNALFMILGGEAYAAAMKAEVSRQRDALKKEGKLIGETIAPWPDYPESLDAIFGKPVTEKERQIRRRQVWVQGCFRLADEQHANRENATEAKLKIMLALRKAAADNRDD